MLDRFKGQTEPEIGEIQTPKFKPSLPPKDVCNSHLFTYVADTKDPLHPKRVLYMEQEKEAYSYLMELLNTLAERAKEYEKLPIDDPDRIAFEYRHWILVYLFTSTGNGILDLDDFQKMIQKWVSPAYFKTEIVKNKKIINQDGTVTFRDEKVITPVGQKPLDDAITTVVDHDLHITTSSSYLERYNQKKPLPK